MNQPSSANSQVLIVGAGPTGLVLALWLTHFGVRVRIIDKTAGPGTTSRALAVQARTLEFYRQMGFADDVVSRGIRIGAVSFWVAGKKKTRAVFGEFGANLSPYPFALDFSQDEHERFLIDRLAAAGVHVERETELVSFDLAADRVLARLKKPDGSSETFETPFLLGCDGARSVVRERLGIGFPGGTYSHLFFVADVNGSGPVMNGDIHVGLDRSEFLAVFPMKGDHRARLVGTIRDETTRQRDELDWEDVNKRVVAWMKIDVNRVNWFSSYRVHHRVADHFRQGRAFLLGDAGHIHSPVGGQGMNTGIGDAVNLAWKIAAVLKGRADASLLDSYEPERIAFARRLVATTDRAFIAVTDPGLIARVIRLDVAPNLLPLLFKFNAFRRLMFRTVSQSVVEYRDSSLSQGQAGDVHGGDRLPWVKFASNGNYQDNFAPLTSFAWQIHIYGAAPPEIEKLCRERKIQLCVFPWRDEVSRTGLRHNALYLIRPDGYVALADPAASPAPLNSYLDSRRLSPN